MEFDKDLRSMQEARDLAAAGQQAAIALADAFSGCLSDVLGGNGCRLWLSAK